VALALVFGPAFVRILERFRRRLHVRWEEAPSPRRTVPAGLTAGCLATALGLALALAGTAAAADRSVPRAVRYLERAQNRDGGFGAAPGQGSSQLITGWTVLGLEAAGRHPLDVVKGGSNPFDFMRAKAGELNDTGELERTVLAVRGAGLAARSFAGRDLVAELLRRRRADGSFSGLSNWTAFGIMALRAAGRRARSPAVAKSAAWLARRQAADGGFSLSGEGASFVDETGAALQGLAAAGRARTRTARRALRWLRLAQNEDGGFGQARGHPSNAQSTAWAVQGIVAARAAPASFRRGTRTPIAYLASLQQPGGSFRYSRTSAQTPVWVTAQVVAALRRRTFPLDPPARRRNAAPARGAAPAAPQRTARAVRDPVSRERKGYRARRPPAEPVPLRRAAAREPAGAPAAGTPDGPEREVWLLGVVAGGIALATGVLLWRRRS
jgi:energy-coupling factor transport system substrate-specific component